MKRLGDLARARIVAWMETSPTVTQTTVAKAVGVTQAWVSRYKAGFQDADCDQLAAMANVFGHTLNELFDLRPDPKERALIEAFRSLSPENRDLAIRMLAALVPPRRGMALDSPRTHHKERR
jgi:transcriptional regulator with XRE-family HTH domain